MAERRENYTWTKSYAGITVAVKGETKSSPGDRVKQPATKGWMQGSDKLDENVAGKADCILALEGNRGSMREDVETFAGEQKTKGFADAKITAHQTIDAGRGRIETRKYTVVHDVGWRQARHGRPASGGVAAVGSRRETGGKIGRETRFQSLIAPTCGISRVDGIVCAFGFCE